MNTDTGKYMCQALGPRIENPTFTFHHGKEETTSRSIQSFIQHAFLVCVSLGSGKMVVNKGKNACLHGGDGQ